jgi:hypothetical protein
MRDDDGYRYHYESSGMRLWLWLVVMPPDAADHCTIIVFPRQ